MSGCDEFDQILSRTAFSPDLLRNEAIKSALRNCLVTLDKIFAKHKDNLGILRMKIAENFMDELLPELITQQNKESRRELLLNFESALVFLYCMRRDCRHLFISEETFSDSYTAFVKDQMGASEFQALYEFRNMLVVCLELMPAEKNKNHLIDLVARITEGHAARYVTGSGQTIKTADRVAIYEKEGHVTKKPRPPRLNCGKKKNEEGNQDPSSVGSGDDTSPGSNYFGEFEEGGDALSFLAQAAAAAAAAPEERKKRKYQQRKLKTDVNKSDESLTSGSGSYIFKEEGGETEAKGEEEIPTDTEDNEIISSQKESKFRKLRATEGEVSQSQGRMSLRGKSRLGVKRGKYKKRSSEFDQLVQLYEQFPPQLGRQHSLRTDDLKTDYGD